MEVQRPETTSVMRVAVVTTLAFIVILWTMRRAINLFDEGIVLVGAMRVDAGDLIHRDFYSIYGPAQYYLVAGLFKLFGVHFLVGRLYAAAVLAAVVGATYYILRRQVRPGVAIVFTVLCGLLMTAYNQYLYPVYPCILLSMVGSYLIAPAGRTEGGRGSIFAAGVLTGLITLFRYDTGFFVLIGHLAALSALILLQMPKGRRLGRLAHDAFAYLIGVAVIFVPAAAAFFSVASLDGFVADIIEYPWKYYAEMRGLPFPRPYILLHAPESALVYLPPLAVLMAAVELIRRLWRPRSLVGRTGEVLQSDTAYLLVFGSLAWILFFKGVVRVTPLHMLMGIVPSLVVLGVLVDRWLLRRGIAGIGSVLVSLAVFSCASIPAIQKLRLSVEAPQQSVGGWLLSRAGLLRTTADELDRCIGALGMTPVRLPRDYVAVASYLAARTTPGERVVVGLTRHDKIFVNAISLYFIVRRLPAVHWHQFDPGLQTRADIQAAMIAELQSRSARWVVRDGTFDGAAEPNGSARSSGVKLLDDFLDRNYRPVVSSGAVSLWLANVQPVPPVTNSTMDCPALSGALAQPNTGHPPPN